MKKDDLYNALSKIDMDYIAESDNFEAVSADFKREKKRKKLFTFIIIYGKIKRKSVIHSNPTKRKSEFALGYLL